MKTTTLHKIKDYVSNDTTALKLFTDATTNKYIIKGSTGIGGTSAVFTITDSSRVIISPLNAMICSKENYRQPNHMFIYGGSQDRWSQWYTRTMNGEHIILNTTPEQVLEMKKHNQDIYKQLIKQAFIIDEWDVFITSEYRHSLGEFIHIIVNELENSIILTTATPLHENIELPTHFKETLEFHHISRENEEPKHVTLAPVANYYNFIKEEADKGNKVLLFTNDINRIKNIVNNTELGYKIQTLVGDTLATKLSKIKTKTIEEYDMLKASQIDEEAQIYILSTKFLIGFDFPYDASVGIFAQENSNVDNLSTNEIVQAYGRVRKSVKKAKIFYDGVEKTNQTPIEQLVFLANKIEYKGNENFIEEKNELISQINNQLTYDKPKFISELNRLGFIVNEENDLIATQSIRVSFPQQYANIANGNDIIATNDLNIVMEHIKGDLIEYNGFSKKSLLLYAAGYLAAFTGNKFLMEATPQRYERLLSIAKVWIDVNRIKENKYTKITRNLSTKNQMKIALANGAKCASVRFNLEFSKNETFQKAINIIEYLYQIQLVQDRKLDTKTLAILNGFEIASEVVIEDFKKAIEKFELKKVDEIIQDNKQKEIDSVNKTISMLKAKIFNNTNRAIIKSLEEVEGIDEEIFNQIMKKADDIKYSLLLNKNGFKANIKANTYTIQTQIDRAETYLLSLLSLSCSGHMFGFKVTTQDNRDFNTITKCTRQLRKYTPYVMYEADIKSAFAAFIDKITGSKLSGVVYQNIMGQYKINRPQAKVMYNTALNDANKSKPELVKFFTNCGYNKQEVINIVKLITVEKGSFYRKMTKMEEDVIKKFKLINDLSSDCIRCHDAIYWPATRDKNYVTKINEIDFDINKNTNGK